MGYEGHYSLGTRCLSEFITTCLAIYLFECVKANVNLPATKGHGMGFGFIAIGAGLAFMFPIIWLGFISAHMNPAYCLCLAIVGEIGWDDFVALSTAEVAGAFLGATLVWLHYLPHFKTTPARHLTQASHSSAKPDDRLLSPPVQPDANALQVASYQNTLVPVPHNLKEATQDALYYISRSDGPRGPRSPRLRRRNTIQASTLTTWLLVLMHGTIDEHGILYGFKILVAALHRSLQQAATRGLRADENTPYIAEKGVLRTHSQTTIDIVGSQPATITPLSPHTLANGHTPNPEEHSAQHHAVVLTHLPSRSTISGHAPATHEQCGANHSADARDDAQHVNEAALQAAVRANQAVKLSVFATRPGIYAPPFNFLTEFMGTVVLCFGALMMGPRGRLLAGDSAVIYSSAFEPYFIGLFIIAVVLNLGGPTAVAINPARDFGPRLAHFLLPISGKGSSEWHYAWVPVVAPFFGGAAGAGLYLLIESMVKYSK
eukprot:jgi/Chlat1/88/Chrsp1S03082